MNGAIADRLAALAADASLEVTPRDAGRLAELAALLPAGRSVYITAVPGADLGDLVTAAVEVRRAGHRPVPHLPARGIAGEAELNALLARLANEAGVDDVLVVAGDLETPAGTYTCSMDVLCSGLLERSGIRRAGVAGHPEGSPDVAPAAAAEALCSKNEFAAASAIELRIVTQFALAAAPYVTWEREARAAGNRLGVIAGIPGVTSPATLLKYALACGIGPSAGVLRKRSGGLLRLATTREWRPDAVVEGIVCSLLADPDSLIGGLHLFPFGGLHRTAAWLSEQAALST